MDVDKEKTQIQICQMIGNYGYNGITRVVHELSARLADAFNLTVICREAIREPPSNVRFIELNPSNTLSFWRIIKPLLKRYDIIHCHDFFALPALVHQKGNAHIVYTHHGIPYIPMKYIEPDYIKGPAFAELCIKYGIPKVDVGVGISDCMVKELSDKYKCKNIVKIPNGIDLQEFHPLKSTKLSEIKTGYPTLLTVGHMIRYKGISFLIKSMPYILKKFPDAQLVLIGKGKDEQFFKKYAEKVGVQDEVQFLGLVEDKLLPYYYNACDIALVSSYWEGFGLPILEAMACGKPVIARNAFAMREHIQQSEAGLLFKKDDPKELVSSIEKALSNYDAYALKARKYAEKFTWKKVTLAYTRIFHRLLKIDDSSARASLMESLK